MRIVNLIENTEGRAGCEYVHGLSFYIETDKHKILMDLGPSDATLENAKRLGIDLTKVDTVVLSHGHYDHTGGVTGFARLNPDAKIYVQSMADGEFYAYDGEDKYRYIGMDKEVASLSQVVFLDGDSVIDDELKLFTVEKRTHELPSANKRLKVKTGGEYEQDSFAHEHFLVITYRGRNILLSGCAHNGILNILEEYRRRYKDDPDVVISGFHLMKKDSYTDDELLEIIDIAKQLKKYHTQFYTCHCTGKEAYEVMRNIMGDKLEYVHSGEEIRLRYRRFLTAKRRSDFMKYHKFFAWATVVCFIMTMITGYQRK